VSNLVLSVEVNFNFGVRSATTLAVSSSRNAPLSKTVPSLACAPADHPTDTEFRVRHDRVNSGSVTVRIDGQLHHIGVGHPHNGTRIILLINGYDIRIINATTGEIIRTLTINPERRYHGTGKPIGGPSRPYGPRKNKKPEPQ